METIIGIWQYSDGGIEAGIEAIDSGNYQDSILLSPRSALNFTASVNFKPLYGDTKVANYVSLIYNWQDQSNYNYAGLMFDPKGSIYLSSSSIIGGEVLTIPPYPGFKTPLNWQFGDSFNLTVSTQTRTIVLSINGTEYLSANYSPSNGLIGLKSTRFYQTVFTDFKVTSLTSFQYRNVADYLSYVKDGGNLIVLNTNGYGYFGNELFNLNQTNDTGIIRKEIGGGNITYVNIYPILNDMENSNEKASYYQEILSILNHLIVNLKHFEYSFGGIT